MIYIYMYNFKNKENYDNTNNKKIAFCFLIYDEINHEDLWYEFFKNVDKNKYTIYIHYKNNIKLKYFEEYKIKNTVDTQWCNFNLVKAQILLYEEAIKDSENYKFILLSNSCIPVKNFDYIYNKLTKDNYSYVSKLRKYNYNNKIIYKISQWSIVNREILKVAINTNSITYFINMNIMNLYCPDEYYLINVIYNNNLEKYIVVCNNLYEYTTYTHWKECYMYNNKCIVFTDSRILKNKSPYNYAHISNTELNYLINSQCLFARKFIKECTGLEKLNEKLNKNSNVLEYIHIPKTAGTSVEDFGNKYNILWGRFNINYTLYKNAPVELWHNPYFIYKNNNFTIVRNPYDRIISEYYYIHKKTNIFNNKIYQIQLFKNYLNRIIEEYKDNIYIYDGHILPQSYYVYDEKGNKRIEYVIKMEDDMTKQLDTLFKKYNLNMNINEFPESNKTNKIFNKYDLEQETLDKIYNFYIDDFKNFNYEKIKIEK